MFSREEIDDISYQQEVDIIRRRLASGHKIRLNRLHLLIHADIDKQLRHWPGPTGSSIWTWCDAWTRQENDIAWRAGYISRRKAIASSPPS